MFLDSQHKMCFIHIPRTGGSWLGYKMMDYCNGYKGVGNEIFAKDGTKIAVGRHTVLQKIYSFLKVYPLRNFFFQSLKLNFHLYHF